MYKHKRELKNCLWVILFLLIALTVLLLVNNSRNMTAHEIDTGYAILVKTETFH